MALESFCKPVLGGLWETELDNGFGKYTPCVADICVVTLTHIVLCCLMGHRLRLMKSGLGFKRYHLLNSLITNLQTVIASCLGVAPLLQIAFGISFVNVDNGGGSSLPPYEVRIPIPWFLVFISSTHTCLYMKSMVAFHGDCYVRKFTWPILAFMGYIMNQKYSCLCLS